MSRSSLAIAVLAAGTGQRFGSLKQLQTLDGQTLIRRVAQTALANGHPVSIVTGAESERIQAELADLAPGLIHNPHWQRGMGHSLAVAVDALQRQFPALAAVMILLADQALIRVEDLQTMLREHAAHPEAIIVADHGAGMLAPPCLFPARYFPALMALDGDRGAKALIQQHREQVRCVDMPHAALDIDTPEDLARALEQLRRQ